MSGLEALGVAANIIQLIDFGSKVAGRLQDFHSRFGEVPKIFKGIQEDVQLLLHALQPIREAAEKGTLTSKGRSPVLPVVEACQTDLSSLDELISKTVPTLSDSSWKKSKKAISSVIRESSVEDIKRRLRDHIETLNFHCVAEIHNVISQPRLEESLSRLQAWLRAPDPSLNYNKALKQRYSNTGSWLKQHSKYTRWKKRPNSILWLHGIAGCGKTVLSSTAVEDLVQHCEKSPKSIILYFYLDFNDPQKQLSGQLIRSLILQLCFRSAYALEKLEILYRSSTNGINQPSEDALLEVLRHSIPEHNEFFIVIDALDECTNREELWEVIEELTHWRLKSLHLLVTSRREKDIEDTVGSITGDEFAICIQSATVEEDIRTYIRHRLKTDINLRRWRAKQNVREEIETALMEKADGMFQWVICQLDELGKCLTLPKLRQSLASLPRTLDATYERILCNIDEAYVEDALHILQWIGAAFRPLRIKEVAQVVAINREGDPFFDKEKLFPDPSDIITICSSLLSVVSEPDDDYRASVYSTTSDDYDFEDYSSDLSYEESLELSGEMDSHREVDSDDADTTEESLPEDNGAKYSFSRQVQEILTRKAGERIVRLAHYSVKEYLVSERILKSPAEHFSILEAEADGIITGDCLAYLCQYAQADTRPSDEDYPLFPYAAEKWVRHAWEAERQNIPIPQSLLRSFWLNGEAVSRWHYTEAEGNGIFLPEPPGPSPSLWLACTHGLMNSAKFLIEEANADVNFTHVEHGSPLNGAAEARDKVLVEYLLAAGADPNIRGAYSGTALCSAAYFGNDTIVDMLLAAGADPNIQGGSLGNPLHAASTSGRATTVTKLINAGADVNAQGGEHGSAIQAAAYRGYEAIVAALLSAGADPNLEGGDHSTALQAATLRGYDTVVLMLLGVGATPTAQGGKFGSALQAAAFSGNISIVKLLLGLGADPRAQGGRFGTALQAAALRKRETIFNLLMKAGADPNVQGGQYGNALQAAAKFGEESMVDMLLRAGADANAQGGRFGNALQAAAIRGDLKIFTLLMKAGANPHAQGGEFGNALQAAAISHSESIIRMLIDAGVDPNAEGGYYGNALQAAAANKDRATFRLLIDLGASLDSHEVAEGLSESALEKAMRDSANKAEDATIIAIMRSVKF